jgi:hypothetical protein
MARVKVIFGRSSKLVGLLIRFFDISPWSHVAIYDEASGVVFESVGTRYRGRRGRRKGLIKTPIDQFKKRYSAWRIKEVWTSNENWQADCEALYQKGVDYDYIGTLSKFYLLQLFRLNLGSKHDDNCSEFVERVLKRFIDDHSASVADWWRLRE